MGKLTQEEKDSIRDAAVASWWEDWFKADYSWDGLTKFPWQGWVVVESKTAYDNYIKTHGLPEGCPNKACQVVPADFEGLPEGTKTRTATLQDYWRDQEGKLEGQEGGKHYTIAHLPETFETGDESWKADENHKNWKFLSTLVTARLKAGAKTDLQVFFHDESVTGTDGRANFRGCVLPALPPQRTASTEANTPVSTEATNAENDALHLTLYHAAIMALQDFTRAIFGSPTNFMNAQFSGGNADFRNAQFSGGNADFGAAQFSGGNADFFCAQFSGGNADFTGAQFSGGNAYFRKAQFSGGNAHFGAAQFSGGNAHFGKAQFSGGNAYFTGAQFSGGNADFGAAQFSGGDAHFGKAQFIGDVANFYDVNFSGGHAIFISTKFKTTFAFRGSRFAKRAHFKDSIFPSLAESKHAFRDVDFLGKAIFNRTEFKDENGILLPVSDLNFPFNAFDYTNFKDQLILTQRGEEAAQTEFDYAIECIANSCKEETNQDEIEANYVALQAGCTTLKQAMERASDKNRAQRYFKFELLARQKRPSTPWLVKRFTDFYGFFADYGGSIWLPLWRLMQASLIFAIFYGVSAYFAGVNPTSIFGYVWGPLDFSLTHIFRPLFIWSSSTPSADTSWIGQYRAQLYGGEWFVIKLIATIQSFLSITLLFLFGLATKRKFQIS